MSVGLTTGVLGRAVVGGTRVGGTVVFVAGGTEVAVGSSVTAGVAGVKVGMMDVGMILVGIMIYGTQSNWPA